MFVKHFDDTFTQIKFHVLKQTWEIFYVFISTLKILFKKKVSLNVSETCL